MKRTSVLIDVLLRAVRKPYVAPSFDTAGAPAVAPGKTARTPRTPAPEGMHSLGGEIYKVQLSQTGRAYAKVLLQGEDGKPTLELRGAAAARAAAMGVANVHVSMSHDAGIATATVIAES